MTISLPYASEWHPTENYAKNLRSTSVGCVPVGPPEVLLANAGNQCLPLADSLLSIDANGVDLRLDGTDAGMLSAPFRCMLPEVDGALIFTADGPEWLLEGALQGAAPVDGIALTIDDRTSVSTTLLLPAPGANYPRASGPLSDSDVPGVIGAVRESLDLLEARAARAGLRVQPAYVAWRMTDANGRTIASSTPVVMGLGVQGGDTLQFNAKHSGSTFELAGGATMNARAWGLRLKVSRNSSAFWRRQAAKLQILAAPALNPLAGVGGYFAEVDSQTSRLNLTPRVALDDSALAAAFGSGARIVAEVEAPLEGTDLALALADLGPAPNLKGEVTIEPSGAWRLGSLTAYTFASEPGELALALSRDPLTVLGREKVCRGRIITITSPVGAGGGWNYGRHHMLLFADDGIYGVSADRTLKIITSTLLHGAAIGRADAVAVTPSAVYAATRRGTLLRLKGSRAEEVETPLKPVAVNYVWATGELWMLDENGKIATMDRRGRCTLRGDISIDRFAGPGLAIDSNNAARALDREAARPVYVEWARPRDRGISAGRHSVEWKIASAKAEALRAVIQADGGGVPQRVLELEISGAINSPVRAVFASPARPYVTLRLFGTVAANSRLRDVGLS